MILSNINFSPVSARRAAESYSQPMKAEHFLEKNLGNIHNVIPPNLRRSFEAGLASESPTFNDFTYNNQIAKRLAPTNPLKALKVYQRIGYKTYISSEKIEHLKNQQRISLPMPPSIVISDASHENRKKVKAEVGKYLEGIGYRIINKEKSPSRIYFCDQSGGLEVMSISATKKRSHVGEALLDNNLSKQSYLFSAVLSRDGRSINIVKLHRDRSSPPDGHPGVSKGHDGLYSSASNEPQPVIGPKTTGVEMLAQGTQPKVQERQVSHNAQRIQKMLDFGQAFLGKHDASETLLHANWLQDNLHLVINEASSSPSLRALAKSVADGIIQKVEVLLEQERGSNQKARADQLAQILGEASILRALVREQEVAAVHPLVRAICIEVPKMLKAAGGPDLGAVGVPVKLPTGKYAITSLTNAIEAVRYRVMENDRAISIAETKRSETQIEYMEPPETTFTHQDNKRRFAVAFESVPLNLSIHGDKT